MSDKAIPGRARSETPIKFLTAIPRAIARISGLSDSNPEACRTPIASVAMAAVSSSPGTNLPGSLPDNAGICTSAPRPSVEFSCDGEADWMCMMAAFWEAICVSGCFLALQRIVMVNCIEECDVLRCRNSPEGERRLCAGAASTGSAQSEVFAFACRRQVTALDDRLAVRARAGPLSHGVVIYAGAIPKKAVFKNLSLNLPLCLQSKIVLCLISAHLVFVWSKTSISDPKGVAEARKNDGINGGRSSKIQENAV